MQDCSEGPLGESNLTTLLCTSLSFHASRTRHAYATLGPTGILDRNVLFADLNEVTQRTGPAIYLLNYVSRCTCLPPKRRTDKTSCSAR